MIIILLPRANVNVWNVGEVTASVEVTFSIGKGNVLQIWVGPQSRVSSALLPSKMHQMPLSSFFDALKRCK